MTGSTGFITPLPVILEQENDAPQAPTNLPKTIVLTYGYQKLIAELPYDGKAHPGCGAKVVASTHRGIEIGKMLTTTCGNGGCGQSVSRKQMLQFIENSGGKDYPFSTQGKVLRVATPQDLHDQSCLDDQKPGMIRFAKTMIREMDLPMSLVEIELLLGGERVIFYYTSEQWVDFRELVRRLASEYQTRIEMYQVNAREEARLVADYERCGQHCCCKQFLKVLKPVSMRSAKVQKATLDPTKISGRCGRLMCCLRYEDETYEQLRRQLPQRQARVQTDDGLGSVVDSQILTQLVLVKLDNGAKPCAYAAESIRKVNKDEETQIIDEALAKAEADARTQARQAVAKRPQPKAPAIKGPRPGRSNETADTVHMQEDIQPVDNSADSTPSKRRRKRRRRHRRGGQ